MPGRYTSTMSTAENMLQEVFEIGCSLLRVHKRQKKPRWNYSFKEYFDTMDRCSPEANGIWGEFVYMYYDADCSIEDIVSMILSDAAANGIEI